jgi:hypothetical protein
LISFWVEKGRVRRGIGIVWNFPINFSFYIFKINTKKYMTDWNSWKLRFKSNKQFSVCWYCKKSFTWQ